VLPINHFSWTTNLQTSVITTASLDVIALGDLAQSSCFPPEGLPLMDEVESGIPLVTGMSNYRDSVGRLCKVSMVLLKPTN